MMRFSLLLSLQLGYMFLGMLYNIVSIILLNTTGRTLSSTSPVIGIITMFAYGVLLLSGCLNDKMLYRLLMGTAMVVLGYSGVFLHLNNYSSPNLYYSNAAWLFAVLINVYGALLNFIAVSGKYKL